MKLYLPDAASKLIQSFKISYQKQNYTKAAENVKHSDFVEIISLKRLNSDKYCSEKQKNNA